MLGALALGVVQSELQFLSSTKAWWPDWGKQGLTDAVPFLVIVVTLFVLGSSIPMRGEDTRSSLPPVILPRNRPLVIAVLFVAGVHPVGGDLAGATASGSSPAWPARCCSCRSWSSPGWSVRSPWPRRRSPAWPGSLLSKFGTGVPFPFSMLLAALRSPPPPASSSACRRCASAVRSWPWCTLAAALTLEKFVFANPQILDADQNLIPDPEAVRHRPGRARGGDIARFAVRPCSCWPSWRSCSSSSCNLMRAGTGRKMLAVRSNERAAASIGIGVAGIKLSAFALASFLAGLGGALIGYSRGQLSPESFGVFVGLSVPGHRLPRRDHQRQRCVRRRCAGRARHRVRDLRPQPQPG